MGFVARPIAERAAEAVRRIGRADAAQQHFERHARKRAAGPLARKHIVAHAASFHLPQDGEGAIGKGNAMLARSLCPGRGDCPDFPLKVHFIPTRRQCLTGSRRSQNAKFKGARRSGRPLAKLCDESRNVGVGHGRMMAARELGALRQQLVEMAAPAGRIGFVAANEAARLGRVQDGLDAPSKPNFREVLWAKARVCAGLRGFVAKL